MDMIHGPYQTHLKHVQDELGKISSCFCLAKWLQVTLHLQYGQNQSCHHVDMHQTSLEELKSIGPSALHNTHWKKQMRQMMLMGVRPEECIYCWKTEERQGKDCFSDRVIKSADPWAWPSFEKIVASAGDENVNPSYVEVSFGHECQMSCMYCVPNISSTIWHDFETHGAYPYFVTLDMLEKNGQRPFGPNDKNPYVDAFWEWFPELSKTLKTLRITGGEPLLNPNTFKLLDYIDQRPMKEVDLFINSNLGISDKNRDRFFSRIADLQNSKKLKSFCLYTSVDTHGKQAEYIRHGLDYEKYFSNIREYFDKVMAPLVIMVTFNALAIPGFKRFLEDVLEVKRSYGLYDSDTPMLTIDLAHLQNPAFLSVEILPRYLRERIRESVEFVENHSWEKDLNGGFSIYEVHKMKRLEQYLLSKEMELSLWGSAVENRAKFFHFIQEYDRRKNKNFLQTFPEMKDFFEECRHAYEMKLKRESGEKK